MSQPPASDLPNAVPAAAGPSPEPPADQALQVVRQIFLAASRNALSTDDLMAVAGRLSEAGNIPLTIALYRVWLEHATAPDAFVIWYNLGCTLAGSNESEQAEAAFRQALALYPQFHHAAFALGSELVRRNRKDEAIELWEKTAAAIDIANPDGRRLATMVLNNLGLILDDLRRYPAAERALSRSLELIPDQPLVLSTLITIRQYLCAWPLFRTAADGTPDPEVVAAISSLSSLGVFDDPELQLQASRRFLIHPFNLRTDVPPLAKRRDYGHDRIRVGYLSSDFRWHAVSLLTVELFEQHDRSRVEVYGFCWTDDEQTDFRQRVVGAMDHLIRINDLDDEAAARCIRDHEIDVLVDLHGLATRARPGILACRPAPVQVTYLGYPGTTAHPEIDYVIADDYVLPAELRPYFSETPISLPTVFQISDRKRPVGARPSRESCGLPADAFVFCSFSNTHKVTPELFAVWMSILRRTPGSVLWLLADNGWAQENMSRHARDLGVEPSRLIFTGRVLPHEYLARYRIADLFLDTFPFNAGTTANDALWMGLPILTRSGRTFASRMAGSLLRAAGLPELIATDPAEYEDKAVRLAGNREQVAALRRYLEAGRATFPLFNIPRIVREIEDAFLERVRALGTGGAEP